MPVCVQMCVLCQMRQSVENVEAWRHHMVSVSLIDLSALLSRLLHPLLSLLSFLYHYTFLILHLSSFFSFALSVTFYIHLLSLERFKKVFYVLLSYLDKNKSVHFCITFY